MMKHLKESLNDFVEELESETTIEENIERELAVKLKAYLNDYLYVLAYCESPIERLFAVQMVPMFRQSYVSYIYQVADFEAQSTLVMESEKEYRVDFLVRLADPILKQMNFVIECDGHDFHEKTKEQVRKDKARERELQMNGYIVIRFSGSEIHNNALKCSLEALKITEEFSKKYS